MSQLTYASSVLLMPLARVVTAELHLSPKNHCLPSSAVKRSGAGSKCQRYCLRSCSLTNCQPLCSCLLQKNSMLAHAPRQWYRLLTCTFLHANIGHLAMNMYSLTSIGRSMERAIEGPSRYALIYCLGGLGGSVCSWLRSPYDSVGASGQSNIGKPQAWLAQSTSPASDAH